MRPVCSARHGLIHLRLRCIIAGRKLPCWFVETTQSAPCLMTFASVNQQSARKPQTQKLLFNNTKNFHSKCALFERRNEVWVELQKLKRIALRPCFICFGVLFCPVMKRFRWLRFCLFLAICFFNLPAIKSEAHPKFLSEL